MSSLRKKGLVDFRQGSPNRLEATDLSDCLVRNDLATTGPRFGQEEIRGFKKQNHSYAKAQMNTFQVLRRCIWHSWILLLLFMMLPTAVQAQFNYKINANLTITITG